MAIPEMTPDPKTKPTNGYPKFAKLAESGLLLMDSPFTWGGLKLGVGETKEPLAKEKAGLNDQNRHKVVVINRALSTGFFI